MQFEIAYTTTYRYEPAALSGLTALRLRPRSRPGLRVLASDLRVNPGRVSGGHVDGWGTHVDFAECAGPHDELSCQMFATVETIAEERTELLSSADAVLYRRDSSRVRKAAVSALVATCGLDGSQWGSVDALASWVNWRFVYRLYETDAETPIEQVVETGMGVCQDFAHVMLAILRSWGWPARYVCGYQFSTEDRDAGRIDASAMHAWVEVYCNCGNWIGLDATTGGYADDRYVAVGHGRDYDDVRPVRGVLAGSPIQTQESHLSIVRAGQ